MQNNSSLTPKEKALIGVGMSVAAGCQPCTQRFIDTARGAGACERGIRFAVESALSTRNSAGRVMVDCVESHQSGIPELSKEFRAERQLLAELISIGAAFAINCVNDLETHVSSARQLGATDQKISEVVSIARQIKQAAEQNVEKALRKLMPHKDRAGDGAVETCCGYPRPEQSATTKEGIVGCGCEETTSTSKP